MWAKCAGRWAVCVWRCLHRAWGQCEDVRNWYMACLSQNLESFASSALRTQRIPKQLIRSVKSGGTPLNKLFCGRQRFVWIIIPWYPLLWFPHSQNKLFQVIFLKLFLENYSWGLPGPWNNYLRDRPFQTFHFSYLKFVILKVQFLTSDMYHTA